MKKLNEADVAVLFSNTVNDVLQEVFDHISEWREMETDLESINMEKLTQKWQNKMYKAFVKAVKEVGKRGVE